MSRKSKETPAGIDSCDMNRVEVASQQLAILYCPRSSLGETRVIAGSDTRSTTLVKKLSKLAAGSVCGGCSYLGKTRVEGEQIRTEELVAEATRLDAETELLRARANQALARAEIAKRLTAAGVEAPAEEVIAPSETPQLPASQPPSEPPIQQN